MIQLTKLSGSQFVLNCEWIKTIEATPDTVITLLNGEKYMVRDSVDAVVDYTQRYRQGIFRDLPEAIQKNRGGLAKE